VFCHVKDSVIRGLDNEAALVTLCVMRQGFPVEIDGFTVFVDTAAYDSSLVAAIASGDYECQDREVARAVLCAGDRVIEAGTAIGLVTMRAARIVGEANIVSFEGNPLILADARANFERNGFKIDARHGVLCNKTRYTLSEVTFGVSSYFLASRLEPTENADIIRRIRVPTFCLEDEIENLRANALLLDIEGGEVDLLSAADLTGIEKIVVELHQALVGEDRTNQMLRFLIGDGFNFDLQHSSYQFAVLQR
jgi:FkbM family methyltransferase